MILKWRHLPHYVACTLRLLYVYWSFKILKGFFYLLPYFFSSRVSWQVWFQVNIYIARISGNFAQKLIIPQNKLAIHGRLIIDSAGFSQDWDAQALITFHISVLCRLCFWWMYLLRNARISYKIIRWKKLLAFRHSRRMKLHECIFLWLKKCLIV